jgi:ABC-type multidrug transport system fused ATPase/permease subunit
LFSSSLKENITYGVKKFTEEDITKAMKMANAEEFVTNKSLFPEGL